MRPLHTATLRWTVGALCALTGMLVLVIPHQFSSITYSLLQPNLNAWGAALVVVGAGLIAAGTREGRRFEIATHLAAGLVLLWLSFSFARVSIWLGFYNYLVL